MKHNNLLAKEIEITRHIPLNCKDNKDAAYLRENLTRKTREVRLIDCGRAYVNNSGLAFSGLRLIKDTYPDWHPYPKFYQRQKLIKNLYLKSSIHNLKEKVLLTCVDGVFPNYYHWLCDILVRVNLVRKKIGNNFFLMLPKDFSNAGFCRETLKAIGVQPERILTLDKREAVKAKTVIFPTWLMSGNKNLTSHDQAIIETRDDVIDNLKNKLSFSLGEKIFISRSKAPKRKIINQKEVEQFLSKAGFAIVNMEDLSFEQQVSASYNAKHIIAQHGAGLTNILFCKEGTAILELKPKSFTYLTGNCFLELAQAAKLNYLCQHCDYDADDININILHTNITVDLTELEKNIELMLCQS